MKRSMLILTSVAVLAAGVYGANYLFAQGGGNGTQASQGTRVAVVNVGYVFNKYKRAVTFKQEIDELLRKPKAEAMRLLEEAKALDAELRKPGISGAQKDQIEQHLTNKKRMLEDMDKEMRKVIGKKQEDNLMTLWREINMGIESVAKAYGFQIVLGYGDPMDKNDLALFPNVNRKMQAMDLGSAVPLYVHPSIDLSEAVTGTLNQWIDRAVPATPASGSGANPQFKK